MEEAGHVARPTDGDRRRAEEVFEDQVPADDPGEEFPARRIGVGVGAPGHGDHRGVFGIAEPGEERGEPGDDEGEDERRAGVLRRHVPRQDEDAGPDRRADAEADQLGRGQHPAQPPDAFGLFLQGGERLLS